jgi:membrane-bound serine protease (ClpP class)
MKKAVRLALCGGVLLATAQLEIGLLARAASHDVIVVPIQGTVDDGMAHLVARAVDDANASHASGLVLEINTPGGLVSSAFEIRDAMFRAQVPTVAYVAQRAFSAGALITLSAQKIVMAPGASLGAAEPIPKTIKTVAALRSEFASTAQRNHRDPTLASAMVDAAIDAPAYKPSGAILSLTADEAKRAGYADAIESTLPDALRFAGLDQLPLRTAQYTFAEQVARFATNPGISGLLLTLGFMGIMMEMVTLHGIAGLVGVGSLALFFGTHVYSGFSNSLVIVLAILGILGILLELHVIPGHFVAGVIGTIALLLAVVLAFGYGFLSVALQSLAIAIALSALMIWLSWRMLPQSAFARRLVFRTAQGPEYVTSSDYSRFLNHTGHAASYLRPAGLATVDGERLDVLTEGEFIQAGTPIRVSRVEGARIFVRSLSMEK